MVPTLLTISSIPELAMRRCVLGKSTFRIHYFPLEPGNVPAAMARPNKDLQTEPKKGGFNLGWFDSAECLVYAYV